MSDLDAVNRMLQAIGQRNVATLLSADRNADVEAALNVLGETSREVQAKGWHFNTYKGYVIQPNATTGEIVFPLNTMRIDTIDGFYGPDYVQRAGKLYDVVNNTYNIGEAVTVDYVGILPWDQLMQAARWYITVRATRRFATDKTATHASYQFTKKDEEDAKAALESADLVNQDLNLPQVNPHFIRMRRR